MLCQLATFSVCLLIVTGVPYLQVPVTARPQSRKDKCRKMSCGKETCNKSNTDTIKDEVKHYYGKSVQKTSDFEICFRDTAPLPAVVRQALSEVHEDVTNK